MFYQFPIIKTLDDVLPAIEGKEEFLVCEKEGYKVVNYLFTQPETFPPVQTINDAILRECRGMIFAPNGQIIARRMHKFFNVNERLETQEMNLDWSVPHIILEKLDGSLVTPFYVNDQLVWGTKMGLTDVATPVNDFILDHCSYDIFAFDCLANDLTPLFEWCSRKNRVVIDHPEDRLILTAIRVNTTGEYLSYVMMEVCTQKYDIELVRKFDTSAQDMAKFIEYTRGLENIEGFVVRFDNGHMLKVKSEWYVNIHKTKDLINSEMKVVRYIINDSLDDIMPFVQLSIDKERVYKFAKELNEDLLINSEIYLKTINQVRSSFTRKEFALSMVPDMSDLTKSLYFKCWDVKDLTVQFIFNELKNRINKCLTSSKRYANIKESLFPMVNYNE